MDEVYLDIPPGDSMPVDLINEIMGMGITVHVSLNEMDQIEARHKNVEWVCGQVAITTSLGYVSGRDLLLKRIMDIVGGSIGALFTLLLTVILGPFIYAASPGPIFFKQTRIGENGRKFSMYKFRSMYMDAEKRKQEVAASQGQDGHLMFKMEHDPRIIGQVQRPDGTWKKGIGGWIRDLSLDEFPQFFNVLKGDMSLVGTRPRRWTSGSIMSPTTAAACPPSPASPACGRSAGEAGSATSIRSCSWTVSILKTGRCCPTARSYCARFWSC